MFQDVSSQVYRFWKRYLGVTCGIRRFLRQKRGSSLHERRVYCRFQAPLTQGAQRHLASIERWSSQSGGSLVEQQSIVFCHLGRIWHNLHISLKQRHLCFTDFQSELESEQKNFKKETTQNWSTYSIWPFSWFSSTVFSTGGFPLNHRPLARFKWPPRRRSVAWRARTWPAPPWLSDLVDS